MKGFVLGLFMCGAASSATAQETSVQIMLDASMTIIEGSSAERAHGAIFQYVRDKAVRQIRDGEITVIDTGLGRNVFSGSSKDFIQDGRILELRKEYFRVSPTRCNNLEAAFSELAFNLENTPADEIFIIIYTTGINTGAPCSDGIDPFEQVPLSALELGQIKNDRIRGVYLIGLDPDQRRPWLHALKPWAETLNLIQPFRVVGNTDAARSVQGWEWP